MVRTLTFLSEFHALVERWSAWAAHDLDRDATVSALEAVAGAPVSPPRATRRHARPGTHPW